MANRRTRKNANKNENPEDIFVDIVKDKKFKQKIANIDNLIGKASLQLYGTDRNSDVDSLNSKFQKIMNDEINSLSNNNSGDISSFLTQISSLDNKKSAKMDFLNSQAMNITSDQYSTMQSFIYDAYRNRLLEQSDLHEVSSQLIELSEAILITRDAIISPDVVEGRMSRSLKFENLDQEENDNFTAIVETMEKKFKTLDKIKNFIIPKTLEYGEYYVYTIPYSKLFSDFLKYKGSGKNIYKESTLTESFDEVANKHVKENTAKDYTEFIESTYEEYIKTPNYDSDGNKQDNLSISKEAFTEDMTNILNNVSIQNEDIPIPIFEEGLESIGKLKTVMEADDPFRPDTKSDMFNKVTDAKITDRGITFEDDKKKDEKFKEINDCYVKMIDPTRIIPLRIMDSIVGYYYVVDEDITPLSGAVSATLYYTKFDEHRKEKTIIDAIAGLVVKNFDKKFLMNNLKFKKTIIDCIQYWNLNEKKLKFQFIPAEYIQVFKIDADVEGKGQSMIKKSLFYAKLYLMLLLFKIMSIILYSNDQRVNYVKQSGIDKNLANKVQEIARIKQSRQINITDLFSYTTLINKVGNGAEMYIPTGRSGERPIETEILSGQDVQLNNDLMEMLKNAYILATGVPAAIINYMNEADFAKVVEQNNTKFNGRVVNYQLDFNEDITNWYKKLLKWSTNLPESAIDNFSFVLQPPKTTAVNAKVEMINQFSGLADFLTQIYYEDPNNSVDPNLTSTIRNFKKLLAKDLLQMIDFDKIDEIVNKAELEKLDDKLKPKAINGDDGNDDGLSTADLGL